MAWSSPNLKPQRPDKKEARLRRKRNNFRRRLEKDPPRYWRWALFFSFGFLTLAGLGLGLALLYYQVLTCNLFSIKDAKNIEIAGLKRLQPEFILQLAKLGP